MAQIFTSPFAQYTDASGNPGSGDKLYFYQTGTTTPITIYSDIALTTPQANPVIADSAGQWPAVYLAEQLYKVVMKSAADVTIRTADPAGGTDITGAASSTDNAVARWDGTTGKKLQNSGVIIDDSNNVTGVVALTATGAFTGTTAALSGALTGTTGAFSGAVTAAGAQPLTLTYVDAGALVGPEAFLYRDSASPLASDIMGSLKFDGKDSAGNRTTFANIYAINDDPTNGSEDGSIVFSTIAAGAAANKASIFNTGFQVGAGQSALIDPAGTVVGVSLSTVGMIVNYISNNTPAQFGRSNSGDLVYWWTAGVNRGAISEAAGTVTYGAFCGVHWTQWWSGASPISLLRGTVIETKDEMCVWLVLDYVDHEGNARQIERVPEGAKIGDVVDYSYERERTIEVEVSEDVFEEVDADHYERKNGDAVLSSRKTMVPVFDILPIVDANGNPVVVSVTETDAKGKKTVRNEPKFLKAQRRRKVMRDKVEKVTETVKATVVELPNSTLPKVGISDTPGSKAVYGVFSHFDDDGTGDFHVAGLGAYVIRVASGETPQNGDLLESNGDGCARVQADDIIRSSTVAKVTAAIPGETYPDGSRLYPCVIYAG